MLMSKPTAELMARMEGSDMSVLVPWLTKIDWILELMLNTLCRMAGDRMPVPELTEVTISGSGISFSSRRSFEAGDRLTLEFILPPFTPIQTTAEVLRATPHKTDPESYSVAARFLDMKPDDQEQLIRHILHIEAEQLRAKKSRSDGP